MRRCAGEPRTAGDGGMCGRLPDGGRAARTSERPLRPDRMRRSLHEMVSPSVATAAEYPDTVPLRVDVAAKINVSAALDALADLSWFGRVTEGPVDHPEVRRVAADLELPIRDGSAPGPVRKSALIDVGPTRMTNGMVVTGMAWRSATVAPLFPVFAGELIVSASGLSLDGRYTPPFGRLGLLIDAALLRLVARRTAQAFLTRVAARLAE